MYRRRSRYDMVHSRGNCVRYNFSVARIRPGLASGADIFCGRHRIAYYVKDYLEKAFSEKTFGKNQS